MNLSLPRWLAAAVIGATVAGCGTAKVSLPRCDGQMAVVGHQAVPLAEFRALLRYTLAFYEHAAPRSPYYQRRICGAASLRRACSRIKRSLFDHLVDLRIVASYALRHNMLPTAQDWGKGLAREDHLLSVAGGQPAFLRYLGRVRIGQARFRWLEAQQLETAKVVKSVGLRGFRHWLSNSLSRTHVVNCLSAPQA